MAFRLTHLSPTFLSSLNPRLLIIHVALTGSFLPQSRQYLPRAGVRLGDRSHGLRAHSTLLAANVCSSSGFSFPKSLPLPLHCPFFTARFKSAAAAALVPVPASTAYLASLSATWHPSRFSWCHGDFTQLSSSLQAPEGRLYLFSATASGPSGLGRRRSLNTLLALPGSPICVCHGV